ncbi:phosphatidylinositol N-acetylglucosaminyltransferase subunit A-like [Ruditapes philippinarum]|uniref:phosphatidylinositol N-acetylglucosaminyltransferase subunit A-like n=1 Tax=Ruditapes philippinarum TaxID=129788 RepID=UPI00295C174B|nr:phosphatidylinositol N-acetylglucosaminyltransferase subunit A-like [Ruditapes philippinarum]
MFVPDPSKRQQDKITIVIVSRLVYRKGMDLLAGIIPVICNKHPDVNFIIGGDGPKRTLLEEIRENNQLQDRVTFLGPLKHSEVRNVLVQGHILINTSLTEAFCIAIVEAACCGLQVVSTRVGGVPEVLPPEMIKLAEPSVKALVSALEDAISDQRNGKVIDPYEAHERIKNMYTWPNVARRTDVVYDMVHKLPDPDMSTRIRRYYQCGPLAGKLFVIAMVLDLFFLFILKIFQPENEIEACPDFSEAFRKPTFIRPNSARKSQPENIRHRGKLKST